MLRLYNGSPPAFGEGKERIKNVMHFKKPNAWVIAVSVVLVAALTVRFAANKETNGTGDYDLSNFYVNGYMLGAEINKIDTSLLTPAEPLNIKDGYDYNFEEIRYSADEQTGRSKKMFVNVYKDGVWSMLVARANGKDNVSMDSNRTYKIEGIEALMGKGETGWYDKEQRLRYVEYRQEEGRLSATVRFVYTDGEDNGITHRLVWVIAESSLPYQISSKAIITHDTAQNITGLDEARLKVSFATFMPTLLPPELVAENITVDEEPPYLSG